MLGPDARHPRAEGAGHRPGRRRRLRRQDPGDAGRGHHHAGRAQARQAGEVHRVAVRVADVGAPRPRPDPGHHDHGEAGRHGHRPGRAPARRHGRVPAPGRAGRADPRRVHVPGDLQVPAYRFVCDGIFTTKTPTDAYRGAGRPEATYAIERIMDELAAELDMDPMELRRKNWIKHEEFPYTMVSSLTYDSGNYEAATDKALELIGWDELAARAGRAPRAQGPGAARPRDLDVHRDVRPRAVARARLAGLRRRRLGERVHPDARHRQGRGRHRVEPARTGARDGVRADRRRQASVSRGRTSRSSTATRSPRPRAWTPTVRARSPSAASRS